MIIDLTSQFKAYAQTISTHQQSAPLSSSVYIQKSQDILKQLNTLQQKISELEKAVKTSSRFSGQDLTKRIHHVNQNIKLIQLNIKRVAEKTPDIKCSHVQIVKLFKNQTLVTMQMKLLKSTMKFKQVFLTHSQSKRPTQKIVINNSVQSQRQINLAKAHFLQQSQQQVMAQVAKTQYKQLERQIAKISQMYVQTLNMVKLHDSMIERISGDVDSTQTNVQEGRKNLSQIHRRQSKNRSVIIKVFASLYLLVFVYIVFIS